MHEIELIGKVGTEYLRRNLFADTVDTNDGVARFLLDRLTGEQVSRICADILKDTFLNSVISIKVPRELVGNFGLPESILTDEKTTYWRNASCDKEAILLANTRNDQGQSLKEITTIGSRDLKSVPDLWVNVASRNLPLTEDQLRFWQQALRGLQEANDCSLEQFSAYVVQTHYAIQEEGVSVIRALGWALPALRLPRDSSYFESIPDNGLGHVSRWRKMFVDAFTKRGCYLYKQNPNRQVIENNQLYDRFQEVRHQIDNIHHGIIEDFIGSSEPWSQVTEKFGQLEWERDKVSLLFSELRTLKMDLGTKTRQYFDDEYPDTLAPEEQDYLVTLTKRKVKEASDEDREFYEQHRNELEGEKSLKSEWDKFVYGRPIECSDFFVGLLEAVHRLFDQCDSLNGPKELRIKTSKLSGMKSWLDLNEDVGFYFCTAYRGIDSLLGPDVIWDTHWLFKYDELILKAKQRQNYKKNTSTSKLAVQIVFYIELSYWDVHGIKQTNDVRLIWQFEPSYIGLELPDDLRRLSEHPFMYTPVSKNPISKKGKLQSLSLNDIGTLHAVFGQDRGSLVGAYNRSVDLSKVVNKALKTALSEQRLTQEGFQAIQNAWEEFSTIYSKSINEWRVEGLSADSLLVQCEAYERLLNSLHEHATGDINRLKIWHHVTRIGSIQVEGQKPTSIIAPWHPLRIAAKAIKARQVGSLINYVLCSENVDFGDSKLFFADLALELAHPYYPEVTVGYVGQQPYLLSVSDTVNDYSLMEHPVREFNEQETNEDPKEATEKVLSVVKKYLELQPHERTNLSVALFNIDSTRLPQSIVNGISAIHDGEEEVRCQVILRHRDIHKLSELYMKMIESADHDPDLMIASEISRDFMARLRIGVMADAAPISDSEDGKPVDIVFLQDVISNEAKLVWVPVQVSSMPALINHNPPRWGRRRPAAKDELKSTVYMVAPSQPSVGWAYLKTVHSIISTDEVDVASHFLPARQISFQNEQTRSLFDEAHTLGEWVINYDDLLEPRLLKSQGVQIIKYQHNRGQGPSTVVSSRSQLNLLKVLVKRRLESLNVSLSDEELFDLTEKFIEQANGISGDIVLRAAKRGVFASELIGVVLSKALIQMEVGETQPIGWFFLDDYAMWLGQREEQIADILALSPQYTETGAPYLRVIVTEAKYVDSKGISDAKKNSQKQLRDTVGRMYNAIFGNPGRLDRDLWLARLSDMLNDGLELPANSHIGIEEWREGIRNGSIPIDLKGYSHVFSSTSDLSVESELLKIGNIEGCYQEVFARDHVRQLVVALRQGDSVNTIRETVGYDKPWSILNPQYPASRVNVLGGKVQSVKSIGNSAVGSGRTDDTGSTGTALTTTGSMENSVNQTTLHDEEIHYENTWGSTGLWHWISENSTPDTLNETDELWANQTVNTLRTALISYNLQAKVLSHRLTPNAVVVKLKGSDQLKVEDIEKKRSQLLTTHAIDVINIAANPGEIVVSLARPQRQTITLGDVWKRRTVGSSPVGMNMSFVLGIKEMDGNLLYLNLGSSFEGLEQHAPHTLIAGATGSGKSVLLQNLILDICATNSKEMARVYLIDPKFGVDYQHLEELPHLADGIIIDQDHAIRTLEYLVAEMDRRYNLFRECKTNSLSDYNSKVNIQDMLPLLFVIHDEFAEWMLIDTYKSAVSSIVQRLGVKARAAGIHLIFAAQRPDANVLPVQLRDNLGNRLILRVESVGTSEISLGERGAERLLGKGHLAARLQGQSGIIYAQVPFVSNKDVGTLSTIIRTQIT